MSEQLEKALLYSSFNARALSPRDVARTFVPPSNFFQLVNNSHTFVVGPRGSGKTTLLKMLQQPAIEAWEHPDARMLRETINFTGVFIPTDITFTSQLDAAVDGQSGGNSLVRAAYSLHVLRAVLLAIEYRVGRIDSPMPCVPIHRVSMTREQEREFVLELASGLKREPRIPSFSSLRSNLSSWLLDLFYFARKRSEVSTGENEQESFAENGFLRLDLTKTAALAIEQFESICHLPSGKWALMFDELELAPPYIVSELTRLVRSTDERFLFKLSLSPYLADASKSVGLPTGSSSTDEPANMHGSTTKPTTKPESHVPRAQENQDFDTIRLWYPNKADGFPFCHELANSVLGAMGLEDKTVDSILGTSVFDAPSYSEAQKGSLYNPGSQRNKRMKRLAEIDPSFQNYLDEKGVSLTSKVESDSVRARTLRKINGIVIVRETYRKDIGTRSRKNPTIYTGASVFYTICEANPRLLIGLLNQLCGESNVNGTRRTKVTPNKQSRVFASASARFRAFLRTIPSPPIASARTPRGLLTLVDKIGNYFYSEVVVSDFDDDPDTSFTVDAEASEPLCESLQRALNAGAIIWVPDASDGSLLRSLRGKRFRLSYLLAPYYRLPLQLGRSISLSKILDANQPESQEQFLFEKNIEE